jgi:alkylhydroperoxidase family enzyme
MRLSILDDGHRRCAKLFLAATSALSRVDSPDIVKMLLYRPDFLTRPLLELTADAMRGPSHWTAGEREYLAMCTAQLHRSPFCIDTHAELTRVAGHGEIDPDDPASARRELRQVRDFLDAVNRDPDHIDATAVTDLPEHAVVEALHIHLVWNVVNRLANAFGFELRDGQLHSGTRALHRFGYRFPGFLLAGGDRTDHGDVVANLRHAVLNASAATDPVLRTAAATGDAVPEPWRSYTETVRDASYKVTDADIARLVSAEHTEDQIFEVTVAAAVGAALRTYDAGRHAIHRKTSG